MAKVLVMHTYYGCETGCCGHTVEIEGERGVFTFGHPYTSDPAKMRKWAEDLIKKEHGCDPSDLDWENSLVLDD